MLINNGVEFHERQFGQCASAGGGVEEARTGCRDEPHDDRSCLGSFAHLDEFDFERRKKCQSHSTIA